MSEKTDDAFEGWAILELMGHRRLGGYLRQQTLAGTAFLRIDVPAIDDGSKAEGWAATQFYSPSAVYCVTPCGEAEARAVAAANRPQPVQRWEMPALPARQDDPWAGEDAEDLPRW